MTQIPIPGGPSRRGPDAVQRAQEAAHLRQARPAPEGPEGEKRPEIVDKTRLSAELTEELTRSSDPQANADQVIQGIQGLDPTRLETKQPGQKTHEIGSASGIDGNSRKRSPRVNRGQAQDRVQQAAPQKKAPAESRPAAGEKDHVDYSAELKEKRSSAA